MRPADLEQFLQDHVRPALHAAQEGRAPTPDRKRGIYNGLEELIKLEHWSFNDRTFLKEVRRLTGETATNAAPNVYQLEQLTRLLREEIARNQRSEEGGPATTPGTSFRLAYVALAIVVVAGVLLFVASTRQRDEGCDIAPPQSAHLAAVQKVAVDMKSVLAGAPLQGALSVDAENVIDRSFRDVPDADVVCHMILRSALCLAQSGKAEAAAQMRGFIDKKCPDPVPIPVPWPEPSDYVPVCSTDEIAASNDPATRGAEERKNWCAGDVATATKRCSYVVLHRVQTGQFFELDGKWHVESYREGIPRYWGVTGPGGCKAADCFCVAERHEVRSPLIIRSGLFQFHTGEDDKDDQEKVGIKFVLDDGTVLHQNNDLPPTEPAADDATWHDHSNNPSGEAFFKVPFTNDSINTDQNRAITVTIKKYGGAHWHFGFTFKVVDADGKEHEICSPVLQNPEANNFGGDTYQGSWDCPLPRRP